MIRRMLSVVFALALACSLTSVVQAGNILVNAGFELSDGPTATPTYWAAPDRGNGFAALSTEQAHSGLQSMKLWSGNPNSIKQDPVTAGVPTAAFDLDPLASYQRSVWVYIPTVQGVTSADILFSTGLDGGYDVKTISISTFDQWVQVADPVLITGKSHLGMFGVRCTTAAATTVYFDDVSFAAVPEPASIAGLLTGGLGMLGFAIRRKRA